MKNFIVANRNDKSPRYKKEKIETLVKAQIDNSRELGWEASDIILVANFDYEFMGVKSIRIELNDFCWTGSKVFALKWYFENYKDDVVWAHDLDCWQNVWFQQPLFEGDVGAVYYSNPKYNGGSIFWRSSSIDIINCIVDRLSKDSAVKEEPTLNKVFKSKEYKKRITELNRTYNVGCSGFLPRFEKSIKPIHVCHFHPYNGIAWEIHALDRAGTGDISVTLRLERLLRRYYPDLATEKRKIKK